MNKRQLGKTDINLTAIGFGGAPLGNLFENLDERNCYDILEKSYEKGINIYDTSPLYGYGLSEHRLGNFLKTVDEDSYFLSTKVGRYLTPAKKNNIDNKTVKAVNKSVRSSTRKLSPILKSFTSEPILVISPAPSRPIGEGRVNG